MTHRVRFHGKFTWRHRSDDGVVWEDESGNVVVNSGLNNIVGLISQHASTESLYIGLTDGSPTLAAADTMGSHAGWSEVTNYDESTREDWIAAEPSAFSTDNAANLAEFTINSSVTIGGAFLSTDSVKNASDGTLVAEATPSGGDVNLSTGTLEVTYKISADSV